MKIEGESVHEIQITGHVEFNYDFVLAGDFNRVLHRPPDSGFAQRFAASRPKTLQMKQHFFLESLHSGCPEDFHLGFAYCQHPSRVYHSRRWAPPHGIRESGAGATGF